MLTGVKFEQQCKLYVHAVKPCYLKLIITMKLLHVVGLRYHSTNIHM